MGILDGVGRGTALGGRYRLEERLETADSSAYWRGVDQTLERAVGVRVVAGVNAEDTLDAARRAALVEDMRLLRVLDVGTASVGVDGDGDDHGHGHETVTFVVAEYVDAPSLSTVLREEGPLPAEQVRTLVGEAAEALERARRAGLHHRRITPESLLRTHDGQVKVAGLAVDAAAAGIEDEDDVTAARQDAVALVAVLYAGLTGRWPLARAVPGLETAPRMGEQATPPADLASGVPNDLDTLCAVTLGPHGDGPRTPGELAEQLAPWGHARAERGVAPATPAAGIAVVPQARPASRFPVQLAPTPQQQPPGRQGAQRPVAEQPAAEQPAGKAAVASPEVARPNVPHMVPGGPGQGTGSAPLTAANPAPRGQQGDDQQDDGSHRTGGHQPARITFAEAIGIGEYADPPRTSGTTQKLVFAAIAALLVVGLILAVRSLASIGGDGRPVADQTPPTATEPAETASPPQETQQPSQPAAPPPAPTIATVTTLDPQGGDGENDETAPLAIDADPSSAWVSSTYTTADFGGLKDGLGLVVHLAEPAPVSRVTLGLNGSGGAFEIRAAPDAGLGGSTVVGTGTVTGEPVEVVLDPPVETQFLIIWFTELPSTDEGFRVELTQVQVQ